MDPHTPFGPIHPHYGPSRSYPPSDLTIARITSHSPDHRTTYQEPR